MIDYTLQTQFYLNSMLQLQKHKETHIYNNTIVFTQTTEAILMAHGFTVLEAFSFLVVVLFPSILHWSVIISPKC
jgi:hypothetical protein